MAVAELPTNKPPTLQQRTSTTATLTIPSRTGHRRILKDIFVKATTSGYIDVSVGNVTLFRIYDNLAQAQLIADPSVKYGRLGFLNFLSTIIPDFPFPNAAQDEDIIITRSAAPTLMKAVFEDQTGVDAVTKTVTGGSMSLRHFLPIILKNNSDIEGTGEYEFDALDLPSGLSPFAESPDIITGGRHIPTGQRYTIYAIAGDFPTVGTTTKSKTTRVYIRDEQIMLFTSENAEGILVDPEIGNELAFNLSPLKAFILPEPYVMLPNRLFTFKGYAFHNGSDDLPAGSQKLILLGIREFVT